MGVACLQRTLIHSDNLCWTIVELHMLKCWEHSLKNLRCLRTWNFVHLLRSSSLTLTWRHIEHDLCIVTVAHKKSLWTWFDPNDDGDAIKPRGSRYHKIPRHSSMFVELEWFRNSLLDCDNFASKMWLTYLWQLDRKTKIRKHTQSPDVVIPINVSVTHRRYKRLI